MLIFLPLYSKPVDGYIYSVSLIEYVDNEIWIRMTYWGLFYRINDYWNCEYFNGQFQI